MQEQAWLLLSEEMASWTVKGGISLGTAACMVVPLQFCERSPAAQDRGPACPSLCAFALPSTTIAWNCAFHRDGRDPVLPEEDAFPATVLSVLVPCVDTDMMFFLPPGFPACEHCVGMVCCCTLYSNCTSQRFLFFPCLLNLCIFFLLISLHSGHFVTFNQ